MWAIIYPRSAEGLEFSRPGHLEIRYSFSTLFFKKWSATPLSFLFIWSKIDEMVFVPFFEHCTFCCVINQARCSWSASSWCSFFHGVLGRTLVQTTWRSTVCRGQSYWSLMLKWRWSKFFRLAGFNVSQQVSRKTQWQLQYQSTKAYLIYLLFMIWSTRRISRLFLYKMTITAGWGDSKIMQIKMMPS